MKILGYLIILVSIMLQAPGEHIQNYLTMLLGIMLVIGSHYLERK